MFNIYTLSRSRTSGSHHVYASLLGSDVCLCQCCNTIGGKICWCALAPTGYHMLILPWFYVQNCLQSLCKWVYTFTDNGSVNSIFFSDRNFFLWFMFVTNTFSFICSDNNLKLRCFSLPITLALSLSFIHGRIRITLVDL